MIAANILDVLLLITLLVYVIQGLSTGLLRSAFVMVGVLAGGAAAYLLMPWITHAAPEPWLRAGVVVGATVLLLGAGHLIGRGLGGQIRAGLGRGTPGALDRIGGGALGLVASALVLSLVLGGVGALGIPLLSRAVAGSQVLDTIDETTPAAVDRALARVRTAVLEEGLPRIEEALGGITESPGAPDLDLATPELERAAESVVRISGTAYACGQSQTGTGFVIARGRIVTNAHVIAGVTTPIIEAPDGQTVDGRVVYTDPQTDLAVIAVSGFDVAALRLDEGLEVGDDGTVLGYPYGGPFTAGGAEVLAEGEERVADIYGTGTYPRSIYALAAVVEPGNSGGPLLALDGEVSGVVFAESATDDELGYAVTLDELTPLAQNARGWTETVDSGDCIPG